MTVEIRVLDSDEASVLAHVAPGVFDYAVDPQWSAAFFADSRHHLAVALDAEIVVGMASGVHYEHPDKPPELFIIEVGVAPTHEGRGFGRRLVGALIERAMALGCTEAWVLTERANVAAQRMYTAAGGTEIDEQPVMFSFRLDADVAPSASAALNPAERMPERMPERLPETPRHITV